MTGFEVPSFLFGLSGVIPVVEKSFSVWQSLTEAKEFGEEMMRIVAQLAFEYHRFLTWARVSGIMQYRSSEPETATGTVQKLPDVGDLTLIPEFTDQFKYPVETAASRIVSLLQEIERLMEKYTSHATKSTGNDSLNKNLAPIPKVLSVTLPLVGLQNNAIITNIQSRHKSWAAAIQTRTPFKTRFLFTSKPWGKADKTALESKIAEMNTWNDRLEKMLPDHLRRSMINEAIPGHVLVDENQERLDLLIETATKLQNEALRTHASLWKEKLDFESTHSRTMEQRESYRREQGHLKEIMNLEESCCQASLTEYQKDNDPPTRAVSDQYSFAGSDWTVEDRRIAISRLEQIIHLSTSTSKPSSLCILRAFGLVETVHSVKLIYHRPIEANAQRQPVSLFSILARESHAIKGLTPPSLERRLSLVKQLTNAVYSLSLVRWLHKDINSHNVIFFRESKPTAAIDLNSPYIVGFSVSRPDEEGQKSLNKDLEARNIYLHPDLRSANPKSRPAYHRKYEIYSLGILMFEIATWTPVSVAIKNAESMDAGQLIHKIKRYGARDIPFFMGQKYCDVVLRCLAAADKSTPESETTLDAFYWNIVMEIAAIQ